MEQELQIGNLTFERSSKSADTLLISIGDRAVGVFVGITDDDWQSLLEVEDTIWKYEDLQY